MDGSKKDCPSVPSDLQNRIVDLKLEKTKLKTSFTKTKNRLLQCLDTELLDKNEIREQQHRLDVIEDSLVDLLATLSELYRQAGDRENEVKVAEELETLDRIYSETHQRVYDAIQLAKSSSSLSTDAGEELGKDMWRQLKRISIPTFSGDKRTYESWKAAFTACIDRAPATPEYKLLQLRSYLTGEALKAIENLGHSAASYDAAKERLERKIGGTRRQIAGYLEELEKFPPMKEESAKSIERFADILDIAVINLKEAGRDSDLDNGVLYLRLQRKMNEQMLTRYHRWIEENAEEESVETLRQWVNKEAQYYMTASETMHGLASGSEKKSNKSENKGHRSFFATSKKTNEGGSNSKKPRCVVCDKNHIILNCPVFNEMDVHRRWGVAKDKVLCFRCLRNNHRGSDCRKYSICGQDGCTKTHNKLLHRVEDRKKESELNSSAPEFQPAASAQQVFISSSCSGVISLRTVPVVLKSDDKVIKITALLDEGSPKSYLNEDVACELGLEGSFDDIQVNLLNGRTEKFKTKVVKCMIESTDGQYKHEIEANTTKGVTGSLKPIDWTEHSEQWKHLSGIKFPVISRKSKVDLLIGLDNIDLHRSVKEVHGNSGEPVARLTPLGWTCVGQTSSYCQPGDSYFCYFGGDLDSAIRRFWEIENIPEIRTMSPEDTKVLNQTKETLKYENGRYEVSIPLNNNKDCLVNNYDSALKRLENTEKKLSKNPAIAEIYSDAIRKYEEKGYISKVSQDATEPAWYLPHFPVVRPDKDTTKVRIVFDASAKHNSLSLNDVIHQGPKLQNDLFDVLLRFRKYPVAIVCDIAEMYLQVSINPSDRTYHRFLWRSNSTELPDIYQFNRLVFGVNASPFLAQLVAQENALKFAKQYSLAYKTVLKSTYMDDGMDSMKTDEEAIELYRQLSELWGKAGMVPRKWLSNSTKVLENIPQDKRASEVSEISLTEGILPKTKTLGVIWSPESDGFGFQSTCSFTDTKSQTLTKRFFLKKIASLFDPLGFLAPFCIQGKIIMQNIWISGLDWDEEVIGKEAEEIREWFSELECLKTVTVPRCIQEEACNDCCHTLTLHTFVDASSTAYGTVVYARHSCRSGKISVRFVAAKSRVAPLTAISIPRQELMAAVLGLRLTLSICRTLEIDINNVTFWSDSMNVLHWIRNQSRQFNTFVANRVGEIQQHTSPSQWQKVPTEENPADYVSRGSTVRALAKDAFWWEGPSFLCKEENEWPKTELKGHLSNDIQEKKQDAHSTYQVSDSNNNIANTDDTWRLDPSNYSKLSRLVRVTAWMYRFINNCRNTDKKMIGPLTADELQDSEHYHIKHVQREVFAEEIRLLKKAKPISSSSKLISLNPKIDQDGLLRADGRLKYAEFIPFDVRYPVILPRKAAVTRLIVKHFHDVNNHSGTNFTTNALSSRYWIIHAREEIRDVERCCTECRRRTAKPSSQIMGPIPSIRLSMPLRAFAQTSVDFGGPFITVQGRGRRREKRYLCRFTCLASRAVHLEIAFGLDTSSFLNAFFRMVNRRGLPVKMLSDNGLNFVGAEKELKELVRQLDKDEIVTRTADKGISWQFNPPYAPHWGGVHKIMIKAAKRAIYAILRGADVNDEELMTAFTGAEALINSRPLTYQSSHPSDVTPLTPNHFLFGQVGGEFAPQSVDTENYHPVKRWRRIQELVRHFWERWLKEWLPSLTSRKKWHSDRRDFEVNDIVLVVSPETPRGHWPLGRITEVFKGRDRHVRAARIRVGKNEIIRSITRLCPLEINADSDLSVLK